MSCLYINTKLQEVLLQAKGPTQPCLRSLVGLWYRVGREKQGRAPPEPFHVQKSWPVMDHRDPNFPNLNANLSAVLFDFNKGQ